MLLSGALPPGLLFISGSKHKQVSKAHLFKIVCDPQ